MQNSGTAPEAPTPIPGPNSCIHTLSFSHDAELYGAEYSKTFMREAKGFLEAGGESTSGAPGGSGLASGRGAAAAIAAAEAAAECAAAQTARSALGAAHSATRLPGSATACVLTLDRAKGRIAAANLVHKAFPQTWLANLSWMRRKGRIAAAKLV